MTESNSRKADFPINPLFLERWSARSFTGEAMPEDDLLTMFEAARWAQSASNNQPWRYSYALRDGRQWANYLDFLVDANKLWSEKAAALVVVIAKTFTLAADGSGPRNNATALFDIGAATQAFTLQATELGYIAHPMAGIHHDKIKDELALPEGYSTIALIAVGKLGPKENLPEKLREREAPSQRQPQSSFVFKDGFKA